MLIDHNIQVSLLWFIELLVCAVALFGAFVPKYRAACILMFCMVALDLYLWPFFDSMPSGSDRYYSCLAINSIFIMLNLMFARPEGTLKNIKLLVALWILNMWEALDVTFNPDKSFIDYNYALLAAISYLIYSVSMMRGLKNGRYNTSTDNDIDIFDLSFGSSNNSNNQGHINPERKV